MELPSYLAYLVFSAVYLAVDFAWIVYSKAFYEQAFGQPVTGRIWAAALAYVALVSSFLFFVPAATRRLMDRGYGRIAAAVVTGAAFTLATFGVYNGTLAFQNASWGFPVVARDMTWGTVSTVSMSILATYML